MVKVRISYLGYLLGQPWLTCKYSLYNTGYIIKHVLKMGERTKQRVPSLCTLSDAPSCKKPQ